MDKCILHKQCASTSIMDQQQIVNAETLDLKCKECENVSFTSSDGSLYCLRCFRQYEEDDFVFTADGGGYGGSLFPIRLIPATIMAEPLAWSQPDLKLWSSVKAPDDDVSVCMKRDYGEAGDGISQNPRNKV